MYRLISIFNSKTSYHCEILFLVRPSSYHYSCPKILFVYLTIIRNLYKGSRCQKFMKTENYININRTILNRKERLQSNALIKCILIFYHIKCFLSTNIYQTGFVLILNLKLFDFNYHFFFLKDIC